MTLLAKSSDAGGEPETLLTHTLAVVEMAHDLCHRLPLTVEVRNDLRRKLELAAALHDIGKVAPGFQRVLKGEQQNWNGWRHEVLSAGFASALRIVVPEEVIFAVLFHHKEIPGDTKNGICFFNNVPDGWPRMLREWRESEPLARAFWSEVCARIRRIELSEAAEVSGITLRPEWLMDSPTKGQCQRIDPEKRFDASLLRGLLISADHLASGHRRLPAMVATREFQMNHLRRPFQEKAGATSGNAILRAPTGSGKTEAALLWAGANQIENGRLFYVLPFTAAINAMHIRLVDGFPGKKDSVGVLHGRASHHLYSQMLQDYPADRLRAQHAAKARARLAHEMYHPIRVCTPHQLLRHSLHGRGWEQMLTEFPGACVIFDEIHGYDPPLAGLTLGTARLLANRFGARTLFASATFPRFLQELIQALIPCAVIEPDLTEEGDREVVERKRHNLQIADGNVMTALDNMCADTLAGKSVLVVCNHVRTAQVIYEVLTTRLLAAGLSGDDIILFHGRFNMEDRSRIELTLGKKPLPRVLVATQVVEVSLDIDFDCGYLEPAPIDAMIQRMGRVNRKGSRDPEPIVVFREPVGTYPIYQTALVGRTLQELSTLSNPLSEHDVVAACDRVYRGGYAGEQMVEFNERLNHPYFTEFEQHLMAGRSQPWVDKIMDTTEGRSDLLPRCLLSRHRALTEEKLWLDADALLVNVRTGGYRDRIDWNHDPPVLDAKYTKEGLQP
jgi:CRISPR-associated endonuclease/helicase Cas3